DLVLGRARKTRRPAARSVSHAASRRRLFRPPRLSGSGPPTGGAAARASRGGSRSHAGGHDVRLWTAISAFDRAIAQGWAEHGRVPVNHRNTARGSSDSGQAVFV